MHRIAVRIASAVAVAATVLGLSSAFTAPAAHADLARLATPSICVRPDFPVSGSGWAVHEAVGKWAEAQSYVSLTTSLVDGCMVVPVRRYTDKSGLACAYTDVQGIVTEAGHISTNIEIGLNDWCLSDGYNRGYLRSVIMHELGHAMGLDHIDSTRSIMYDYHGARRFIAPVDVRALAAIYA